MRDEYAFLKAIREHPDDTALRLVYADWLEDRGDPRSQTVRELAQRPWQPEPKPPEPIYYCGGHRHPPYAVPLALILVVGLATVQILFTIESEAHAQMVRSCCRWCFACVVALSLITGLGLGFFVELQPGGRRVVAVLGMPVLFGILGVPYGIAFGVLGSAVLRVVLWLFF